MKPHGASCRRHGGWIAMLGAAALLAGPGRFTPAASPSTTPLGTYRADLHAPGRLASDANARLYVTDPQADRVVVYDAFGRVAEVREGLAGPLAIAVAPDGTIYLGEERTGSVSVFDARWNRLCKLGIGDGEFVLPNHIAIGAPTDAPAVYVSDSAAHRVKVYTNGVFACAFGSPGTGPAEFDFPTGIFVCTNHEVWVVDQNNNRVQVFDGTGGYRREFTLITSLGGMGMGSVGGRSQGVAVDAAGRSYVADAFQGFTRVFDTNGTYLSSIGTFGDADGQLRSPAGIAIDGYSRLFVASPNNGSVVVVGLDAYCHLSSSPGGASVPWGTPVTFTVRMGGSGPFTYRWRRNGRDLTDGPGVLGATNATLFLASAKREAIGTYSVVVTGPGGSLTSPESLLRVDPPTGIVGILIMLQ